MKNSLTGIVFAFSFGAYALVGQGCFSIPDRCDNQACVAVDGSASPDGPSKDGSSDAEPPPKDCLTPSDPSKNPEKCLVDSFGAFVSPTGDDANDGTKAKPFKTIGKALGTARSRIVVCEGEYAGSLDVARAVEIYGGVTCDFTKPGARPRVTGSKAGYALKVSKVTSSVVIADLDVMGANAASPGESSVGVVVSESASVRVLRSRIEAGDGADAAAKKDGNFTFPPDAMLRGASGDDKGTVPFADDTGGAGGTTGACPGGGTSTGGRGADNGAQGTDATPRPPGGAKGGASVDCSAVAGAGTVGDPGSDRAGATSVAVLGPDGVAGSKGLDGTPGTIGGGGGGGFGFSGAGGGGGAGGCGGQGGFGGGAGGSSVALVVFASDVGLEATELVAKTAKPGGPGGTGQAGQLGGARGNGSNMACQGGNGAQGGNGGHGGGGAGGISAGIAWSTGKEPTRDATTKITRATTPAPLGGEGGGGTATKGVDGVHADVFEVK